MEKLSADQTLALKKVIHSVYNTEQLEEELKI